MQSRVSQSASFILPEQEAAWFAEGEPRPGTLKLVSLLRRAGEHGLRPSDYSVKEIEIGLASLDGATRSQTAQLMSDALTAYSRDLRIPRSRNEVTYIDPELEPIAPEADMLLAGVPPIEVLHSLQHGNPIYERLRVGLLRYRLQWGNLPQIKVPQGPTLGLGSRGQRVVLLRERLGLPTNGHDPELFDLKLGEAILKFRDEHGLIARAASDQDTIEALNRGAAYYERIIIANLDRLRGLPLSGRYVLVDTAGAELRLIDGGNEIDTMRAIVGAPSMETPLLAGFIRYAVINPYWNVPPDLVRASIVPNVLREGTDALARNNFVLFQDWQSEKRIDPRDVDWPAIAQGRENVWVRQLPGGSNMMGEVKFMLPNNLGIYLHDTPLKSDFQRDNRRLSSGCVRVEDADRLARWLVGGQQILNGDRTPERRVDLPEPIPVFITYLTADFEDGRIAFRPDVERKDQALMEKIAS